MAATVTPIDRTTVGDRVAEAIRREIWDGALRSGDRLNQEALATQLGVSRIPVREALMGLEREGVVRVVPHRGAFVEPIDEQTVSDHFELYALVDGFALRKACERADADQLTALAAAYERAAAAEGPDRLQVAVVDARALLHQLGGSPRFRAVARGLAGIVPGNFFEAVDGSMDIARHGLPEVSGALAARDAVRAVHAYTEMMTAQGRQVLAELGRRGLVGAAPDHRPTEPHDLETS